MARFFVGFPVGACLFLFCFLTHLGLYYYCPSLAGLPSSARSTNTETLLPSSSAVQPVALYRRVCPSRSHPATEYTQCPDIDLPGRSCVLTACDSLYRPGFRPASIRTRRCTGTNRPSRTRSRLGRILRRLQLKSLLPRLEPAAPMVAKLQPDPLDKKAGITDSPGRGTSAARSLDERRTGSPPRGVSNPSTTHTVSSGPYLALEWKRYPFDFAKGEFVVGGFPLYVDTPDQVRAPELRQDADTGNSVWDGSVVLARFVARKLFPVPSEHTGNSDSVSAAGESTPTQTAADNFPRVIVDLGSGLGVAGLATAAAATAAAVHRRITGKRPRAGRKQDASGEQGTLPAETKKPLPLPLDDEQCSSRPEGSGHAGRDSVSEERSADGTVVILTDLPYCIGNLMHNVWKNQHFLRVGSSRALTNHLSTHEVVASGENAISSQEDIPSGEATIEGKTTVFVSPLDWNEPQRSRSWTAGNIDTGTVQVLVGADVVWLTSLIEPLVKTIRWFCDERQKWLEANLEGRVRSTGNDTGTRTQESPLVTYLAHQTRSELTDNILFATLAAQNLQVEVVPFDDPVANRSPNIRILKIWGYS